MQDELILEQAAEEISDVVLEEVDVSVDEDVVDIRSEVVQHSVDAEETEVIEIDVSEGFTGNTGLNVAADHSRYLPNQHTIGAITGLREELDEIERLKDVCSDNRNQANYYLWEDENPSKENRDGYFVSIRKDDNRIRICTAEEDEFGVTVSSAGFIGGQEIIARDEHYGLVVHSGVVGVRCETDVEANDYVVSDDYGVAKKTDGTYGYLVTAISNIEGIRYAIVSLTMPSTQMQKFSEITQDVQDRMEEAEINIATAISVANAAYNKAQHVETSTGNNNNQINDQLGGLIDKVGSLEGNIDNMGDIIAGTTALAEQAKNVAHETYSQAITANKESVAYINGLIDALDPNREWTDEMGNNWREYLADYIKDGVPTKSEIYALDGKIEDNTLAISKNAAGLESIASSVDIYSVGEYSQAYGLTLKDMWNILKVGMIYIPTTPIHAESYEYITVDIWEDVETPNVDQVYYAKDTQSYWYSTMSLDENNQPVYNWQEQKIIYSNGNPIVLDEQEFTQGYYYIWNGLHWVESDNPLVYFSAEYPIANEHCIYWYRDSNKDLDHDGEIYEAYGLYKWDGFKWQKVNMLSGNITNRATSRLIQTASEISADVTNSRGWLAHMGVRITEDGAFSDSIASTVTQTTYEIADGHVYMSLDDIPGPVIGKYYAVGEIAPYDIYTWDGEKFNAEPLFYDGVYVMKPNTASIITAANKYGDTSIGLNADRINFDGVVTFTQDDSGVTTIKGGGIRSGYIASNNFMQVGNIIESGTLLDLNNGSIYTPNFKLDQHGNVSIAGRITATSGYIAGFTISGSPIWRSAYTLTEGQYYYFIYNDVNYYFIAPSSDVLKFDTTEWPPVLTCGDINVEYDNRETISNSTKYIILIQDNSYIGCGQTSLSGDNSGSAGVYISSDGIGLGNGNFVVDNCGNVTMGGNLTLKTGVITWDNLAADAKNKVDDAFDMADSANNTASSANAAANTALSTAKKIANGTYYGTFISGTEIYSPTIHAQAFNVYPDSSSGKTYNGFNLYGPEGGDTYHMLQVKYQSNAGLTPFVIFNSPDGATAYWQFYKTMFSSTCEIDFNGATVKGLNIEGSGGSGTVVAVFG